MRRSKDDSFDYDDDKGGLDKFIGHRPNIEIFSKQEGRYYENGPHLPYEMWVKIFKNVIDYSEHPLKDLCSIGGVSEHWRLIVLNCPQLWSRIDLTNLPTTDRNIALLKTVISTRQPDLQFINELSVSATLDCKKSVNLSFIESLIKAPNLTTLSVRDARSRTGVSWQTIIIRAINNCTNLKCLSITDSKIFFNNQKWITDHLIQNGMHLEVLNLAMSLNSISTQLFRSITSDNCPNLKVLDISTCDALNTHSFDAHQLTLNIPSLEVLRVGNVSFKRIYEAPDVKKMTKLKELSMPIGMRDADRDDPLLATLTYGSDQMRTLDIRGSSITPYALLEMPSYNLKELHMDDICPINRPSYSHVISKWSHSLEVVSLVKINCAETIKKCLVALAEGKGGKPLIRDLDLSSSDVSEGDLKQFLQLANSLTTINLSSCRSLPRGCKGQYWSYPPPVKVNTRTKRDQRPFEALIKKLDINSKDSDDGRAKKRTRTTTPTTRPRRSLR